MDNRERDALIAAGFRIGDAEDFLGLSDEERKLVELRLSVRRAARKRRHDLNLSQAEVAKRMKSSQPRVNMIENGAPGISLELMFRELFALGGDLSDLIPPTKPAPGRRKAPRS